MAKIESRQFWIYKGHKITDATGKKKGFRTFAPDGTRWLGTYNWSTTLNRISREVVKLERKNNDRN